MFAAPGLHDAVNFTLHAAIRPGQPSIDGCTPEQWACPDEDCGCPFTLWALCGMHATETTQKQQVDFLTCYDSNNIAFSDEWVTDDDMPTPQQSALQCVNQTEGLNYTAVMACGTGSLGPELQQKASDYYTTTFPQYASGTYMFHVPNVYINNVQQQNLDLWSLTKVLCDDGAKDTPLCAAADPEKFGPSTVSV